ncbi:DUF3301 domain-containing protein [Candidatus Vondammii sp. HM_W22]|uniref:DUF3301 domain-containing protein n=1 Tax=Candidatus Vondammii sp. HM_W22 TaxID=2687299 RepID=UPI001F144EE2|nr:DUF3301 domain-containing protein [Candidatus Vondammii sp. HM_W22]
MSSLTVIIIFGILAWLWLDGARARELATGICKTACAKRNVQFLDQTVSLRRLDIRWTTHGIRFRRQFRFDYSEEGMGRLSGHITLIGVQLEEFSLGLPTGEDKATPFSRKPPE